MPVADGGSRVVHAALSDHLRRCWSDLSSMEKRRVGDLEKKFRSRLLQAMIRSECRREVERGCAQLFNVSLKSYILCGFLSTPWWTSLEYMPVKVRTGERDILSWISSVVSEDDCNITVAVGTS